MTTTHPTGGGKPITVSVNLESEHASALDTLCNATASSRAGAMRRTLVAALREEGYLPDLSGSRPVARTRSNATRGQRR